MGRAQTSNGIGDLRIWRTVRICWKKKPSWTAENGRFSKVEFRSRGKTTHVKIFYVMKYLQMRRSCTDPLVGDFRAIRCEVEGWVKQARVPIQ
jgi:hypothetical protein